MTTSDSRRRCDRPTGVSGAHWLCRLLDQLDVQPSRKWLARWAATFPGPASWAAVGASVVHDAVKAGIWSADHHQTILAIPRDQRPDTTWIAAAIRADLLDNPDHVNVERLDLGGDNSHVDTVHRFAASTPGGPHDELIAWLASHGAVVLAPLWLRRSCEPDGFVRAFCARYANTSAAEQLISAIVCADGFAELVRQLPVSAVRHLQPMWAPGKIGSFFDLFDQIDDSQLDVAQQLWSSWGTTVGELLDVVADVAASRTPSHQADELT